MNALREEIYVNCPVGQAHLHLDAFFREQAEHLTLRVPQAILGVMLHHDVKAEVKRVHSASDASDTILVRWEAVGGGPYPRFEGKISVKGDEDYISFRLVLDGSYEPPLGMPGEVFDALIGRWIAIATARDLLQRLRDAIEASHLALEASKGCGA